MVRLVVIRLGAELVRNDLVSIHARARQSTVTIGWNWSWLKLAGDGGLECRMYLWCGWLRLDAVTTNSFINFIPMRGVGPQFRSLVSSPVVIPAFF